MTFDIALWLTQDGITNGAIYALLALALLLVFAVTRVIFVPQGEFISYAALSMGLLQLGQVPGTVWVLIGGGLLAAGFDAVKAWREHALRRLPRILVLYVIVPIAMSAIAWWAAPRKLDPWLQSLVVLGLVVPSDRSCIASRTSRWRTLRSSCCSSSRWPRTTCSPAWGSPSSAARACARTRSPTPASRPGR